MLMLELIFKVIIVAGLFTCLVQLSVLFIELHLRRRLEMPETLPPVSILKPLKGLDDQLERNLLSFFELEYPEFEIIFGLRDSDDPARAVIEKLQNAYPHVRTRLEINACAIGLNPKVNNLYNTLPLASHAHVLISDSNVRVETDYLKRLVSYFVSGEYGMVTSIVRGLGSGRIGSIMENLHLNSTVAGIVLSSGRLFNRPVCIGKSLLIEKKTLEAIGGVASFRNMLAEDYFMGRAVQALGLRVATANQCIDNIVDDWSFKSFAHRHLRWAQMRLHTSRLCYASEFVVNPLPNSLIFHLVWPQHFGAPALFATLIFKLLLDIAALKFMRSDLKLKHCLVIPFKDFVIYAIWFLPYLSSKVVWRGNNLHITKNTYLLPA